MQQYAAQPMLVDATQRGCSGIAIAHLRYNAPRRLVERRLWTPSSSASAHARWVGNVET